MVGYKSDWALDKIIIGVSVASMKTQLVLLILVGFLGLTVALPLKATDGFPEAKSTQEDSNVVDDVSGKIYLSCFLPMKAGSSQYENTTIEICVI